jgi:hypothetical protein
MPLLFGDDTVQQFITWRQEDWVGQPADGPVVVEHDPLIFDAKQVQRRAGRDQLSEHLACFSGLSRLRSVGNNHLHERDFRNEDASNDKSD